MVDFAAIEPLFLVLSSQRSLRFLIRHFQSWRYVGSLGGGRAESLGFCDLTSVAESLIELANPFGYRAYSWQHALPPLAHGKGHTPHLIGFYGL
jgi:hypothetical protein